MRTVIAAALVTLTTVATAIAAPVPYKLEPSKSTVGFVYELNATPTKGQMPVRSANIAIDFENLSRSSVDVTVNAARAKAGLIFATQALKAPSVLNTSAHPTIRFVSKRIRLNGGSINDGAKIDGNLTIRGVTRPVTLNAALFRQRGSQSGDLSRLSFRLTGAVNRSDFGASGYPDLVKDTIKLDIVARIRR